MDNQQNEESAAVYVAGVLALTDPGPAAGGTVVQDARGRMVSHRAHYLGHSTGREAELRALVAALRLARQLELHRPRIYVDDPWLAGVLRGEVDLPVDLADFTPWLDEAKGRDIPVEVLEVAAQNNPARTVALAPLVQWLPERTRRAEQLDVKQVGDGQFEVASQRSPDTVYRVELPTPEEVGEGAAIRCECPDYQYRGIPCKHLLVVAQATGGRERLFYPEAAGGTGIPGGPAEGEPGLTREEK